MGSASFEGWIADGFSPASCFVACMLENDTISKTSLVLSAVLIMICCRLSSGNTQCPTTLDPGFFLSLD